MELRHEGSSTPRLPVLNGSNYAFWKARMIAFLKSIDNKSWKTIITRYEHPIEKDVDGKVTQKPEISWSNTEGEASLGNSRVEMEF